MCTVTVLHQQRSTIITMNRDEQRTRMGELPPARWADSALIAPRDGQAGGTWVGVSTHGHWACILNSYAAHAPSSPSPSRGWIIPILLAQPVPMIALMAMDFSAYRPFRIMLGDVNGWHAFHWNGQALVAEDKSDGGDYFMSSSSWNEASVLAARKAAFARWQQNGSAHDEQGIASIHRWQEAEDTATGILMERSDAHTTSLTQITLSDTAAPVMQYWPAAAITPISLR